MFHVHYKALWAAIGEPDSRFRKPAALGRMIERVMLLDVVLDDGEYTWLGPALDKRRFFLRRLNDRLSPDEYPRLVFGDGPAKSTRLFPDKLPVGVQSYAADPHVFVYLVTRPSPMHFRLSLLRHGEGRRSPTNDAPTRIADRPNATSCVTTTRPCCVAPSSTSASGRPASASSQTVRTSCPRERRPLTTSGAMFSSARSGKSSGFTR